MFRFIRNNVGSKRGSLVLSLVASGTVAATIVATHQVAQRFASGAVGAFNQQQAFILAQKSLAVAGLMVNRNVVLCSNMPIGFSRVQGCDRIGPLADDDLAQAFYNSLGLDDSWFTVVPSSSTISINTYARAFLELQDPMCKANPKNPNCGNNPTFKNAKITWALRSLKDSNLRSVSAQLIDKGYICRHKETYNVIENGFCPSYYEDRSDKVKLLSNRDSDLLSDEDKVCTDGEGGLQINDSVCDYFADSDRDHVIIFISVKVPYQSTDAEEEKEKYLVMNAAIRRPMAAFIRLHTEEDSSMCPVSCALASRPHMGTSNVKNPDCVGMISGAESGGDYFQDDIHTVETKMKVKNYGPGVLYGLQLHKEDVDPGTGRLLGKSMVGFKSTSPPPLVSTEVLPLEPVHWNTQEGERDISHITPCYSYNFYRPGVTRVTCDCESSTSGDYVNTPAGVICLKDKSICNGKRIFAGNAPSKLEGSEARESLSGCLLGSSDYNIPAVSNSILTVFEQPCENTGSNCELRRIDSDQFPSGSTQSWCGNPYTASTTTGRERRPPNTHMNTNSHVVDVEAFPIANQDKVHLPVQDRQF